jgi:putative ABC transport system substrate-binding protein
MQRRDFMVLLGSAAAWPLAARAQQPMQVIGLLNGQTMAASAINLTAFRRGLAEMGFVEGRNLAIVYRGADGDILRLPELATELVRIPVPVIAAVGGDNTTLSAKAATATIPIVFTTASDPVEVGFVASLNRPGGNVTGATTLGTQVATKQIGLLRDMIPKLATIGLLMSPLVPMAASITREVQAAAQAVGLQTVVVNLKGERDIDAAFAQLVDQRADALVIPSGAFFTRLQVGVISLAERHAIPAIFSTRASSVNGGLMSYGADVRDTYRQAGLYVARILKGEKPADLPVMQPTKFELVINMKTVKALGLLVPPGLLAIADEVFE